MRAPLALAVAVALLGGAARASDGCIRDGIEVFPKVGSVVPTNFRIILEGLGDEQDRVSKLLGRELVLQAADDRVSVKVLRGWRSTMSRTALILRPRAQLKPNRVYQLLLEDQLPGFRLVGDDVGYGVLGWRTGKGPDGHPPRWLDKPAVSEGKYVVRNGQLSRFLKFRMALQDESPAYAVLSIRRARGPTTQQIYFAPIGGDEAWVGHDGCSGGFSFEDGRAYRATLEAYDVAGNQAPPVPAIEFQAPRQVSNR